MEGQGLMPFVQKDSFGEGQRIRKIWHNDEWYLSVVDVIEVLTDSQNPRKYWTSMKNRDSQLDAICIQLKLLSADSKNYKTDCANTEGVLRIVMSIPSPRVEPLKLWLAQVGAEKIGENEQKRLLKHEQIAIYRAKGRSDEWIEKRMDTIEKRNLLTDEWKNRGVKEGQEYSILTATISEGTFGIKPSEHKKIKGLDKSSQNLQDNMTELELIFTSLGELLTRQETVKDDAQGFEENKNAAVKAGNAAGVSRTSLEKEIGRPVVSSTNLLPPAKDKNNELPPSDDTPTLF